MRARRSSLLLLLLGLAACTPRAATAPTARTPLPAGTSVAVLPFRAGGQLDMDAAFAAREGGAAEGTAVSDVPDDLGDQIARMLSDDLQAVGVPVMDVNAVRTATPVAGASRYDSGLAARVGRTVGARMAVLGAVTRYEQRVGTAWGVTTPATVWYQAVLIQATDGSVIARDRFEYTQQPLTANVLDLPRFLQGGGRWMTREELLQGALKETAEKFVKEIRNRPEVR